MSKKSNKWKEKQTSSSKEKKSLFTKSVSNRREGGWALRLPTSGLRWACLWGGGVGIVLILMLVLSFGLIFGYKYFLRSSYFAIKEVAVSGNFRLTSREILETCRIGNGGNLLAVRIDELRGLLTKNPWIEDASVRRMLPDKLVIGVSERKPCFWVEREGQLFYADASGNLIASVQPGSFSSLPILMVELGAEDMRQELPEIVDSLSKASLPINMSRVSWLRLSPGGAVELQLESSNLKIMVFQDKWQDNLNSLSLALADLGRRGELKKVKGARAQNGNVWVVKG